MRDSGAATHEVRGNHLRIADDFSVLGIHLTKRWDKTGVLHSKADLQISQVPDILRGQRKKSASLLQNAVGLLIHASTVLLPPSLWSPRVQVFQEPALGQVCHCRTHVPPRCSAVQRVSR